MKRSTLWIMRTAIFIAFSLCVSQLRAMDFRLADVVGGGNGSGNGTLGQGIDPLTGGTTRPAQFEISQPDNTNNYHSSTVNFVNGVFIPDGGAGAVTLDSASHTFSDFPNTDSNSWDMIEDGPNETCGTSLSGVNYDAGSQSMIGFSANKGITFDLQAIEAAHPRLLNSSFSTVVGLTHLDGGYGTADWWVFVDGVLQQSQLNTPGGVGFTVNIRLTHTNHYLTLVSTDDGDGYLLDQIIFGDPVIHQYLPGDFNLDNSLTAADIPAMLNALTNISSFETEHNLSNADMLTIGDLNGDGKVNNADLQALLNLLKSGGGSAGAVPEPASLVLLAAGSTTLMLLRRRALLACTPRKAWC